MPLRPLPTPYKIGIDICHIPRIRRLLLANTYRKGSVKANTTTTDNEDGSTQPYRPLTRSSKYSPRDTLSASAGDYLLRMNQHLNPHFLMKLFREDELQYLHHVYQRVAGTEAHEQLFQFVAGRWAAKEAIIKAASSSFHHPPESSGRLGFSDIRIWRPPNSDGELSAAVISKHRKGAAPVNEASESRSLRDEIPANDITLNMQANDSDEELDGDIVSISISHEKDYAVATALFC